MNNRTRIWPHIAAALVIALAAGVVWGLATVWSGYLATQVWQTNDSVAEQIQLLDDGTPVILSSSNRGVYSELYRTLDGQPVQIEGRDWLSCAYFNKPPQPPGVFETPLTWSERLAPGSNHQFPLTGWYLVRDDQPLGHAYLVGYDEATRLRVGYIGRNGFRPALPPRDEWFDIGRHRLGWWDGAVCSSTYIQFGGRAESYPQTSGDMNLPAWLLFVIDGDRLLEIDLRPRSVQTLLEIPGMLGVAVVTEPANSQDETNAAASNPDAPAEAAAAPAAKPLRRRHIPPQQRLAIRMTDRIVILDPPTGAKREYVLPESLREKFFNVGVVGDDQLFVQSWKTENIRGDTELVWLRPDGTVAREQSVALGAPVQTSEREAAWMVAGVAPVPIGWLLGVGVFAPLGMLQSNNMPTYADGLAKVFDVAWLPLLTVVVVGIFLAWLTYRSQRKYRRPATGAWTTFVLLLGVPGFLAYWLEQRKPKMESCNACGEIVPRDREACAACDAQFPTPPLVGTEIFA